VRTLTRRSGHRTFADLIRQTLLTSPDGTRRAA